MKKAFAIFAALGASVASLPTAAHAVTVMDSVTCSTNTFASSACNGLASDTKIVGAGAEFNINVVPNAQGSANPLLTADFSNGILTLQGIGDISRTFSGTTLTFINNTRAFTSVALASGTFTGGALVVNGALRLNLIGTTWNENAFAQFAVTSVPEPGTWMLMMLGLGAVGFSMRRSQKAKPNFQFA